MIEPTDEMKVAFRAAQEQRAAELVAEGAPLGAHDILDRGLAAVLPIAERGRALERDVVLKAKRWAASDDAYDTERLLSAVDQLTQYEDGRT